MVVEIPAAIGQMVRFPIATWAGIPHTNATVRATSS
jgi:hypothetical protein